jgi:Chaperone of endosialidase
MSYTINLTDGAVFATIADGTINTQAAPILTLVGKNYAGYGQFLDTNFIRLLENGSNTTAPGAPLTGQLWWDSGNNVLKCYNGSTFKVISGATSSSSAPSGSNSVAGDLWYDSVNAQLNVYTGTSWLLVGPQFTAGTGTTGAIVATITDNVSINHVVIELYVNDSIVGIISKDAAFTPQSTISGFTTVRPGITLSTLIGSQIPLFQGTATNSQQLNSLSSTSFMRTDANTSTNGTLTVLNNSGLSVGLNTDFNASVSGSDVTLKNITSNGNLNLGVNVGGSPTNAIIVNGSTGAVTIPNLVVGQLGNITVNNILNGLGPGLGNIGNASSGFNTVFATNANVTNVNSLSVSTGTVTAASTVGGVITGSSVSVTGTVTAASTVGGVITGSSASVIGTITAASTVGGVISGSRISATGNVQAASVGVGTAATGVAGEIVATNNITAYYSDDRLKNKLGNIEKALEMLTSLNGFYYEANQTAQDLGYTPRREVGLSAQEVQKVLPEIVVPAPIDNQYLTIHYEKMIPLIVEAIKELNDKIDNLSK